ncbi:MAG TPA: response regulator [Urbifossiella sp.]|jgi:CheY-like chemotaxis protein|nr:response regulator [Urbifossiella sp.]
MLSDNRPAVLVIDDDAAVRMTLGAMVERNGYASRLAGSGDEGVRVYDRHREEIAAVLLDVRMPGMDGPATLVELRMRNPELPCVFVTGFGGQYSDEELAGRGAVVLSKPVGLVDLDRALRAASGRN